jgi:hypothetical protein
MSNKTMRSSDSDEFWNAEKSREKCIRREEKREAMRERKRFPECGGTQLRRLSERMSWEVFWRIMWGRGGISSIVPVMLTCGTPADREISAKEDIRVRRPPKGAMRTPLQMPIAAILIRNSPKTSLNLQRNLKKILRIPNRNFCPIVILLTVDIRKTLNIRRITMSVISRSQTMTTSCCVRGAIGNFGRTSGIVYLRGNVLGVRRGEGRFAEVPTKMSGIPLAVWTIWMTEVRNSVILMTGGRVGIGKEVMGMILGITGLGIMDEVDDRMGIQIMVGRSALRIIMSMSTRITTDVMVRVITTSMNTRILRPVTPVPAAAPPGGMATTPVTLRTTSRAPVIIIARETAAAQPV